MKSPSRMACIFSLERRLPCVATAVALLALVVSPVSAEDLNVDLGTHWGVPSSTFGAAAGQPGTWNEVGVTGSAGLVDTAGSPTSVTMTVSALTDTGWTGSGSDDVGTLIEDNIFSSGGGTWSVSLGGLADGAYELYLYAPAHPSVASGDVESGTFWHPSISGAWSGSFVEGTNHLRVTVLVTGGQLEISSGLDTTHGLAGLQLVEVEYTAGFNVDLGVHWGPTVDGHGAASGQIGPWNEVGLAGSAGLVDVIGRTTSVGVSVIAQTQTGWTGSGSTDAALLLEDNIFTSGSQGGSWSVSFSGLEDGSYDVYLYAPANSAVSASGLQVNGADQPTLSGDDSGSYVEGVNFARIPVTVSGGVLSVVSVGGSTSGLAGLQIVPTRAAPSHNVDFGTQWGVPQSSFAAVGTAGDWQRLGTGQHVGLRDAAGSLSATTVTLTAFVDTGWTGSGSSDAQLLLEDNFFASGGGTWSVEIDGLPPGEYELILYAPSHPAVTTGPMTVNGDAVAELAGDTGSAFVQGASWIALSVDATEGRIVIEGGAPSASGLAGLQIGPAPAPPVPALGPVPLGVLALGLAALGLVGIGPRASRRAT